MQRDLTNYIRAISDATGGGGGQMANPDRIREIFAPTDLQRTLAGQGIGAIGNQFTGAGAGLNPWMQSMNMAVENNPAVMSSPGGPDRQAVMPSGGVSAPGVQMNQGVRAPQAAGLGPLP